MNKFLDMTPPVAAALKAGTPVVVLETGSFCRAAYPRSLQDLRDAQQQIWAHSCVPCAVAVINGRLKAGLSPAEEEALMSHRVVCSRGELPMLAARGLSAAVDSAAALAIAALAGIVPVLLPGLTDSETDLHALSIYGRLVFSGPLGEESLARLRSRGIPALRDSAGVLADTWQVQRELGSPESTVCPGGDVPASACAAACEAAVELKRRSQFT